LWAPSNIMLDRGSVFENTYFTFFFRFPKHDFLRFLRATAVPAGTAEARISYGDSVCLSVCLSVRPSQPGAEPSPGEIETSGLHHMVAGRI